MSNVSSSMPLVSVVIPAYNAEAFLDKALDSVLAQTYRNLEVIVMDDGSMDQTANIALRREGVRCVSKPNGGLSSARNEGIRQARGEYIAYLDADDYWYKEKIAKQVALMEENRDIGFCSTAARVESPSGEFLNIWPCPATHPPLLELLFQQNGAVAGSGSSVMVRKNLQMEVGFFDESLRSLEDIDMWMRLSAATGYACIPEALTIIQKRPESMSRNLDVMRLSAVLVMNKNRRLLPEDKRGAYWRDGMAATICDYAKWEARCGRRGSSLLHLTQALMLSPINKFKLCVALILAVLNPWRKL